LTDIRVTYSGLIGLTIGLASVFSGLVFTLIVTRRLSPEEFGMWSIIGSMITYFLITEPIISYWSTRQIARGEKIGQSSIFLSSIFSLGSIPAYLILAIFVSNINEEFLNTLFLGALLLPLTFVSNTLVGINLGHKPHATSYSLLVFEVIKIPAGLSLVYFFDLGINGAIIATTIAYLLKIVVQLYYAKPVFTDRLSFATLRRWLKLAWIPLYSNIPQLIWSLDVVLYVMIIGSAVGVGYFAAALAVSAIISQSGLISQALYPKLLVGGKHEFIRENFTRLLYFAIPLWGVMIVFAKPALFTLNPVYEGAWMIVIILSTRAFFYVLTGVLYQILMGIEKVDVEKNPSFSKLAKSKLFLIPSLRYIQNGLYIVSLVVLFVSLRGSLSELEIVYWWALVMLALQIPFFIYAVVKVRIHTRFSLPLISILKYAGGTLSFIAIFYLTADKIINYKISIFEFLPSLILELGICLGVYFLFTYSTDNKTRQLFKSIILEVRKKD